MGNFELPHIICNYQNTILIIDRTDGASRLPQALMEMAGIFNAAVTTTRELNGQGLGERLSVEIQASTHVLKSPQLKQIRYNRPSAPGK